MNTNYCIECGKRLTYKEKKENRNRCSKCQIKWNQLYGGKNVD